jgi:hypothetical protein
MKQAIAITVLGLLSMALATAGSEMCFLKSEKLAEGNKICYYSCPSGPAAFTVKSYELCPLNIKR